MPRGLLDIAQTIPRSRANGPGERYVVWLQGCSLRCEGCWNESMWPFGKGRPTRPQELVGKILATAGIEGVTLTGGEPFAQAGNLVAVASRIRKAGLSVMVFTGYELGELTWPGAQELLTHCDIVVAGRFVQALRSFAFPWRGSSNQSVHFLTEKYDERAMTEGIQCEVHVGADGSTSWTGFPSEDLVRCV